MGASYTSDILVGVKLTDLATLRVEEKEFDEFDRKGKATGKKFKEKEFYLDFIDGTKYQLETEEIYNKKIIPKLYSDELEGVDGCGNNLELINLNYYTEELDTDNYFIGKRLFNNIESGAEKIDVVELSMLSDDVSNLLETRFGYKGSANLFLYKNIC